MSASHGLLAFLHRRTDEARAPVRAETGLPLGRPVGRSPTETDYNPPSTLEPLLLNPVAMPLSQRRHEMQKQLNRMFAPGFAGPLPPHSSKLAKLAQDFILESAEAHGIVGGKRIP